MLVCLTWVASHQGGHTLVDFSSRWSLNRVVSHQGGLSLGWYSIRVVFHWGGLSSGQAFIKMVSPQDGLSPGWSHHTIFHYCGL